MNEAGENVEEQRPGLLHKIVTHAASVWNLTSSAALGCSLLGADTDFKPPASARKSNTPLLSSCCCLSGLELLALLPPASSLPGAFQLRFAAIFPASMCQHGKTKYNNSYKIRSTHSLTTPRSASLSCWLQQMARPALYLSALSIWMESKSHRSVSYRGIHLPRFRLQVLAVRPTHCEYCKNQNLHSAFHNIFAHLILPERREERPHCIFPTKRWCCSGALLSREFLFPYGRSKWATRARGARQTVEID